MRIQRITLIGVYKKIYSFRPGKMYQSLFEWKIYSKYGNLNFVQKKKKNLLSPTSGECQLVL